MDCKDLEIIKEDINKFIEELEKNSKDKIPLTDNEKIFLNFWLNIFFFLKNYIDLINLNIF